MTQIPAGWYPDGSGATRWWDGTTWTEHVSPPVTPQSHRAVHPATGGRRRRAEQQPGPRRTWLLAVAGVVLLLAVAGGAFVAVSTSNDSPVAADAPRAPAVSTPTPVVRPQLDQLQLDQALLTVTELPAGYSIDPSTSETTPDITTSTTASAGCEELTKLADPPPGEVATGASFVKSPLGTYLFHGLASGPYETERQQFDALRQDLTTCKGYVEIQDGSTIQNTVTPLSMPTFGDDSLAFRLASTQDGSTYTVDFVVVMRGSTVLILGAGGLSGAEPGVLEQLTPKALTKLDAVTVNAVARSV